MSEFIVTETECGKVKGVRKISALGKSYNAFLCIRYAKPPIGELRFKDPLPPMKYDGVYDATAERMGCYEQSSIMKKIIGSEDSLFLNIFSKNIQPQKLQPVMVYIHGGTFQTGTSSMKAYSPDYLLMADIVVVTINYRLGALGFLSLADEKLKVPGNAGLKDQLMALKFIKNNVENFGGDPNNITLFGHSSGGCSVNWHCVSEESKGLFNKAIIMGGCILNNWSLTPHSDWPHRLARKLGYNGSEVEKEILEFLQKADPIKIVEFQKTLIRPDEEEAVQYSFAPTIERYTSEVTFILKQPIDLQRIAWSNDIDIMIGGTSGEGIIYLDSIKKDPALLENFKLQSTVPWEVGLDSDNPAVIQFVESMKEIYYPTSNDPTKDEMAFCKIRTDQFFWHGLHRVVQGRQNSGGSGKTFLYRFDVDSPTQNHFRIRRIGPDVRGVSHADELCYIFKSIYGPVPEPDTMEFKSIHRFVSLLTSFASSGNPNENVIKADLQNVDFEPVDSLKPPFKGLNIGAYVLTFDLLPEFERLTVLNQLFKQAGKPLY